MSESAMRATMWRQPAELRRLLADRDPAARAAEPLAGRPRVLLAARDALVCLDGGGPDAFGYDVPGRRVVWEQVEL